MRFAAFRHPVTVPGDGTYLLSERFGTVRLGGALGQRVQDLCESGGEVPQDAAVETAVRRLLDRGLVREDPVAPEDAGRQDFVEQVAALGELSARQTGGVARGLVPADRARPATVAVVGPAADEATAILLGDVGLAVTEVPRLTPDLDGLPTTDLVILVGRDHLDPQLLALDEALHRAGVPRLVADLTGTIPWIGPLLVPDETACLACLAPRLRGNDVVRSYLEQRGTDVPPRARLDWAPARAAAGRLLALQVLHAVTSPSTSPVRGAIVTTDLVSLATERHQVHRRPQCPVCGDAGLQARMQRRPVQLVRRHRIADDDGGFRASPPEDLVRRFTPQISHLTGAVKQLVPMPSVDGLHAYQAGQNFALPMRHVGHLKLGLRSAAAGKGRTDAQARASAIGEAIERNSGRWFGDEAVVRASLEELGEEAVHPNEVALYSETQIRERDAWNAKGLNFQAVCDPLDPHERIEWTPLWSMSQQRFRYLPTMGLFYGYPFEVGNRYASADSNGCAAGATVEEAILQGFFELVERDSVAIWWYNRLAVPEIDLSTFDNPYFAQWCDRYRKAHRDVWLLDVTSDLGVPSVVAVSCRNDKAREDILLGFGAHYDVEVAISRAMTEMNQFLPALVDVRTDDDPYPYDDPEQQRWWRTATTANQPYLLPKATVGAADFRDVSTGWLDDDVRTAVDLVGRHGMDFLVLQQTRPDLDLPVVKVVVPGMRHFWTRFAPGRLYDVPVRLGRLDRPTPERELNPTGMFL